MPDLFETAMANWSWLAKGKSKTASDALSLAASVSLQLLLSSDESAEERGCNRPIR
jgi:hypothetical protein